MKKLMLMAMSIFVFSTGYGQVQVGPRVGISSTKIVIDGGDAIEEGDRQFGFHAGAFARFNLGFIYLQPELLFTSTTGEIQFSDDVNTTQQIAEIEYNRLDVPVLIGLNFGAFRINAGPSLRLLLNVEDKEGLVQDVKENYKDATVGYQLGIGLDVGNLLVDLKYEGSLSKFSENITFPGNQTFSTDQRTNQFILSLGFVLFE